MRLLVVEDEKVLREALVNGLKIKGYAVDAASDGEQADVLAYTVQYDLIILDVNLPIIDGFTVLKNIRRENKEIPVLILSALDEIEDKVKGLDLGANDYLTKAFIHDYEGLFIGFGKRQNCYPYREQNLYIDEIQTNIHVIILENDYLYAEFLPSLSVVDFGNS